MFDDAKFFKVILIRFSYVQFRMKEADLLGQPQLNSYGIIFYFKPLFLSSGSMPGSWPLKFT